MNYNFRCGEIFFLDGRKDFLFICKFCNKIFPKFDNFSNHRNKCFPKQENIYLVDVVKIINFENMKLPTNTTAENLKKQMKIDLIPTTEFDEADEAIDSFSDDDNNDNDNHENNDYYDDDKQNENRSVDKSFIEFIDFDEEKKENNEKVELSCHTENESSEYGLITFPIAKTSTELARRIIESFSCDLCTKSFYSKSALYDHKKAHHPDNKLPTERPFQCELCKKRFTRYDHLKGHKISKHEVTNFAEEDEIDKKPYKCNICPAAFTRPFGLKLHERHHTGEKPYSCPFVECSKRFIAKPHLRSHLYTHTRKKQHSCDICPETFVHLSGLRSHKKRNPATTYFQCSICELGFHTNYMKDLHEQRFHNKEEIV